MKQKPNAYTRGRRAGQRLSLESLIWKCPKPPFYVVSAHPTRGEGTSMRSMSLSLGIAPSHDLPLTKPLSCGTESTSRSGAWHQAPSTYAWRP